jgi:hypothetical protein
VSVSLALCFIVLIGCFTDNILYYASWQPAITFNIGSVILVISVMSAKRIRHGLFTATIEPQTLMETDSLRGDIPRSRWVDRALKMYNASKKKEEQKGVRGARTTNLTPTTPPTPTSTEARKTNIPLYNGGFRV